MAARRAKLVLVIAATLLSVPGLGQTNSRPDEVTGLGVEDFSFSPTTTNVRFSVDTAASFTLTNRSEKRILGYSLRLQLTLPDGSPHSIKHSDDFTGRSLPAPTELIESYRQAPVKPLDAGERRNVKILVYNDPMPVRIEPIIEAVVFEDNSVEGDTKRAINDFFEPHRRILDESKWYLQALKDIEASNVREGLGKLLRRYLDAMAASHATVAVVSKTKLSFDPTDRVSLPQMYLRFRLELQECIEQIDLGKLVADAALQRCLTFAEPRVREYSAHLTPTIAAPRPQP
jgi:hypothetical protein